MGNAAGAEHLEGVQEDNAAAQAGKRERLARIEPLRDGRLGCEPESGLGHVSILGQERLVRTEMSA